MPDSLLIELVISVAGIALLVAVSWVLGAWRSVRVTERDASDRLAFDEPDFRVAAWLIGSNGKAAAALSADGEELAVIFALGDNFASRRLSRRAAGIDRKGCVLRFKLGEVSRRAVSITAPDEATAARWLSLLAGAGV